MEMDACTDGYMHGDEGVHGGMDGGINRWVDEWMEECIGE